MSQNKKVLGRTGILQLLELTKNEATVQDFETGYKIKRSFFFYWSIVNWKCGVCFKLQESDTFFFKFFFIIGDYKLLSVVSWTIQFVYHCLSL